MAQDIVAALVHGGVHSGVIDEKEQLVAQGRVRLLCIDEERELG